MSKKEGKQSKGKQRDDEEDEFVPGEGTAVDNEDTLVEEERLAAADGGAAHAKEIASLEAEADLPIEEVLRRMQEGAGDEEEEEEDEEAEDDDDDDDSEDEDDDDDDEEEEDDDDEDDDGDEGEGEDDVPAKKRKTA